MKKPFALYVLIFLLIFLAFGGIYGGIAMLLDPSGNSLEMSEILPLLPVSDYILPGIFLFFVMGLAPLFLSYALLTRPVWVFPASKYHWSWIGTLVLGVILALWLVVEGVMIGFRWPIQYVTAVNGLLVLVFALLPSVRRYYSK